MTGQILLALTLGAIVGFSLYRLGVRRRDRRLFEKSRRRK